MNLIYDNIQNLYALCRKYKVKSMYVFGSILTPRFNDESDVDLLVKFEPEINHTNYSDNYFDLWDSLKELFGREVDLVDEVTLSNPYFIKEVERTKTLIV